MRDRMRSFEEQDQCLWVLRVVSKISLPCRC